MHISRADEATSDCGSTLSVTKRSQSMHHLFNHSINMRFQRKFIEGHWRLQRFWVFFLGLKFKSWSLEL